MLWLWSGLTSKHVQWNPEVLHYDWSAYHESQVPLVNVEKSTMFSSYAVLGDEYLHTLFRFGFHFAVVDCMVGPAADQNYLHLRFKGGGGLDEQRLQRLEVVARLLDRLGFTVKTTGDLLEASIKRRGKEVLQKALRELGIVLGKTVQLDMRIHSKEQVLELVAQIEASLEAAEQEQLDRG
jgi:pyruvate,water dikinase